MTNFNGNRGSGGGPANFNQGRAQMYGSKNTLSKPYHKGEASSSAPSFVLPGETMHSAQNRMARDYKTGSEAPTSLNQAMGGKQVGADGQALYGDPVPGAQPGQPAQPQPQKPNTAFADFAAQGPMSSQFTQPMGGGGLSGAIQYQGITGLDSSGTMNPLAMGNQSPLGALDIQQDSMPGLNLNLGV